MTVGSEVSRYLLAREPIFDQVEFIWDGSSFDAEIAGDFAEIGASGRCYNREAVKEVVLGRLAGTHALSLLRGYRIEGANVRALARELVQVRYTLHAQGRVTRRSTLYRMSTGGWQAVFHQGTVVEGADARPPTHPVPKSG